MRASRRTRRDDPSGARGSSADDQRGACGRNGSSAGRLAQALTGWTGFAVTAVRRIGAPGRTAGSDPGRLSGNCERHPDGGHSPRGGEDGHVRSSQPPGVRTFDQGITRPRAWRSTRTGDGKHRPARRIVPSGPRVRCRPMGRSVPRRRISVVPVAFRVDWDGRLRRQEHPSRRRSPDGGPERMATTPLANAHGSGS